MILKNSQSVASRHHIERFSVWSGPSIVVTISDAFLWSAKKGKKWVSSKDRCDLCGLCDPNGYCTLYDNEPKCKCPQGFGYVIPGNRSAGCV